MLSLCDIPGLKSLRLYNLKSVLLLTDIAHVTLNQRLMSSSLTIASVISACVFSPVMLF